MRHPADSRGTRPPRPYGPGSINKTLTLLGAILDVAEERELIVKNPMRVNARRRKLKAPKRRAVWLDRAAQVRALLDAAGELDRAARPDRRHVARRAIVATMCFAGLRITELCTLRWRDVDLAAGRLWVADSKTDASRRYVELLPALRDELSAHKAASSHARAGDFVFATASGGRPLKNNVRSRVFNAAVERANENLEGEGLTPLPEALSPHKLRHTCCSVLFACGWELPRVMAFLGHADRGVTLRIYAHVMAHQEGEREALRPW